MKLKVTVEIQKMEEEGSYRRDTMYEQTKEFREFDMMKVITAFNEAEAQANVFIVDPARMDKVITKKKEKKDG